MIFDRFCGAAERYLPAFEDILRKARIFIFDIIPHEELPKALPSEKIEWIRENFFLPFPVVAVEDKASCIVISDPSENTIGLSGVERYFAEFLPMTSPLEAFPDYRNLPEEDLRAIKAIKEEMSDVSVVAFGIIKLDIANETKLHIYGVIDGLHVLSKEGLQLSLKGVEVPPNILGGILKNASTAIQELMTLNTPDRFVLEVSPLKEKHHKSVKIPRSVDRPRYTILHPHEIRKAMGIKEEPSGEKRASPRPHERRRHLRTYRDDRYTNFKGKTVVIPATWVGPSEVVRGNTRYKVLLDI